MNHLRVKTLVHVAAIILVATLTGCTWASAPKALPQTADVHPSAGFETPSPQPVTPESRGEAPVDSQAQSAPDNRASNETATVTNSNNAAEKVKGNGQGRSRGRSSTSDTTPPTIVIGSPTPSDTSSGPVTYLISYNDADSITLRKRDVTLNTTGSALGSITVSQSGAKSRTIAISNITGNGTLAITIAPGTAVDAAGNVAAGAGPSETVEVVNPAPTLTIGEPSDTVTNTGPVSFKISYANADTISLSDQDITLSSQEGVTGSVNVAGSGTAERTVTVDNLTGIGTFSISVAAGTAENVDGETSAGAGPSASVDVYGPQPTLEPGPGFDGPTPQPDAIGTGPGSDAKAIARWDVVPYQTFDGIFQIGVVAFHINGIDRVEFSLEGGPWTAAMPVMTRNPLTKVNEYWVNLDASLLPDGPIEIRAVAYPTVGIPRVLAGPIVDDSRLLGEYSIFLSTNADKTLTEPEVWVDAVNGDDQTADGTSENPFQSLWQASAYLRANYDDTNGSTIYCQPGEYEYYRPNGSLLAQTSNRWLTLTPAPGVDRSEVLLIPPSEGLSTGHGLYTELLRLRNITITATMTASPAVPQRLWLDTCHLRGESLWSEGWYKQSFATDCLATTISGHVFMGSDLVRNARVIGVAGDVFVGTAVVLASRVSGQDNLGTAIHSDMWQPRSILDNIILYGIDASATDNVEQGFFTWTSQHRDVALVNCWINVRGYPAQNQWHTETHHFYMRNCTFLGAPFLFSCRNGFQSSTNILIEQNVFQWVNIEDFEVISEETVADRNHFVNHWPDYTERAGQPIGSTFGENATTGLEIPEGVGAVFHN